MIGLPVFDILYYYKLQQDKRPKSDHSLLPKATAPCDRHYTFVNDLILKAANRILSKVNIVLLKLKPVIFNRHDQSI